MKRDIALQAAEFLGIPEVNFRGDFGLDTQETRKVAWAIAGSLVVIAGAMVGIAIAGLGIASAITREDQREGW